MKKASPWRRRWGLGFRACCVGVAGLGAAEGAAGQTCEPYWSEEFPSVDLRGTQVLRVLDVGGGPMLHAGGAFSSPSPFGAHVARKGAGGWEFLGPGPLPVVHTAPPGRMVNDLAAFDDGSGVALFAITTRLQETINPTQGDLWRWSGAEWEHVAGQIGGTFYSAFVHDDGTGTALYIGGSFTQMNGVPVRTLARWRGGTGPWEQVGNFDPDPGLAATPSISAMHAFDDGRGTALYVAGRFLGVDGVPARHIARWDGQAWEALGAGITGQIYNNHVVQSLASMVEASGPMLYAGGRITTAGGAPASAVARWDGQQWHAMGQNQWFAISLAVSSAGGHTRLYASGGSQSALRFWDGSAWQQAGMTLNEAILGLAALDSGAGDELWAAGQFSRFGDASGPLAPGFARYDGQEWHMDYVGPLARGTPVVSMLISGAVEFQGRRLLYFTGPFERIGDVECHRAAMWDGEGFHPTGAGMQVSGTVVFDDGMGGGPAVYAALRNPADPGDTAVGRWDGEVWEVLPPAGTLAGGPLVVFDEGKGAGLYAVVRRTGFLGLTRWTGSGWAEVAGSLLPNQAEIRDVVAHDDGGGPALYVAGSFLSADGHASRGIARWRSAGWESVGGGLDGRGLCLDVHDDGSGPALYVGGDFRRAGTVDAHGVARWDGGWSPVGPGLGTSLAPSVMSMAWFDDGHGARLYIALWNPTGVLARLEGGQWQTVPSDKPVYNVRAWDDGRGEALWVGGRFATIAGVHSRAIARYVGCAPPTCYANCDGSTVEPILNIDDFTCFVERFAQGRALPHEEQIGHYANCDGSTVAPVLNVEDFVCFVSAYAMGCR